jgi:hypothetical protein
VYQTPVTVLTLVVDLFSSKPASECNVVLRANILKECQCLVRSATLLSEVFNGYRLLVDLSRTNFIFDVPEAIVILSTKQAMLVNPRQYPLLRRLPVGCEPGETQKEIRVG